MEILTLARPDDWHLHLRDGAMLRAVLPHSACHFARALIMPNLTPPIVSAAQARAYHGRIRAALPRGSDFQALMTLYLTEDSDPQDIATAHARGDITAVKLYPQGITTHAAAGVRDFAKLRPVLEVMAANGIPLCIHGEDNNPTTDIFDREARFIERILDPMRRATPGLRVVLEHITTCEAIDYVREGGKDLAATLTVHHLFLNRTHILGHGLRPHYYCLPIAKREHHRLALRKAATSGEACFFLGTDSAPHSDADKQSACGCAGCFTAPVAMALLAYVFEEENALCHLEAFASRNGAAFYRLPVNEGTLTLTRHDAPVPGAAKVSSAAGPITVFAPCLAQGGPLRWRAAPCPTLLQREG